MIALVDAPIDPAALREAVRRDHHGCVVVFEGVTRNTFEGREVLRLSYEAYAPLAIADLEAIRDEAEARWPGVVVAMVHRLGVVDVGEASVVIAVGAPHRPEGYEASRFCLEALKARVPIWKQEIYADGSAWKANAPGSDGDDRDV